MYFKSAVVSEFRTSWIHQLHESRSRDLSCFFRIYRSFLAKIKIWNPNYLPPRCVVSGLFFLSARKLDVFDEFFRVIFLINYVWISTSCPQRFPALSKKSFSKILIFNLDLDEELSRPNMRTTWWLRFLICYIYIVISGWISRVSWRISRGTKWLVARRRSP